MMVCVINHTMLFPGEGDLEDVMEEVTGVTAKWNALGLVLRLQNEELDTISINNNNNATKCLKDMLVAWLQQRYDIKKFDPPSWKMLCLAISKPAGGNNPALAREIAERHHGMEIDTLFVLKIL